LIRRRIKKSLIVLSFKTVPHNISLVVNAKGSATGILGRRNSSNLIATLGGSCWGKANREDPQDKQDPWEPPSCLGKTKECYRVKVGSGYEFQGLDKKGIEVNGFSSMFGRRGEAIASGKMSRH
jgi:hypothetical protein